VLYRLKASNMTSKIDVILLHEYCNNNKKTIATSKLCGCFYCCEIYSSQEVHEYVDNNTCALCPKCGTDSVLPDTVCQLTVELLNSMHEYWFKIV
jgi:hypothetical protein